MHYILCSDVFDLYCYYSSDLFSIKTLAIVINVRFKAILSNANFLLQDINLSCECVFFLLESKNPVHIQPKAYSAK